MKYILIILFCIINLIVFGQYTPMSGAGYQYKRIKIDSTIHLPSFCGIPTLRGSNAKEGAIAIDTCANVLYKYTNQDGWTAVGDIDTTSLSNRIDLKVNISDTADMLIPYAKISVVNLKLNISDTASMLSKYLRKADTASLSNRINLKLNISDTASMLIKYLRKVDTASLSNRINLKLNISDTASMLSKYLRKVDTASLSSRINLKLNISDTASMLSKYLRKIDTTNKWVTSVTKVNDSTIRVIKGSSTTDLLIRGSGASGGGSTDTTSLSNRINQKLNISDTASMLSPYLTGIDTTSLSNRINLKLNISDTASMLSPYLTGIDTASLSNRINQKLNISDTSNKWVNNIYKKSGIDSIYFNKSGFEYAIKDSIGYINNGRFGNDTATILMAKIHNDAGVQLTNGKVVTWSTSGTSSDVPSVKLANNKSDATSANTIGFITGTINVNDTGWAILSGKIEKLNTSSFSNGDIIYLDSISGNWTKTKPKAPYHMVYLGVVVKANAGNGSIFVKCQNGYELDEIHDVKISTPLNNEILAYSDTQSLWKNRNIYTIVDTTSLSSRINLKVNISDTANMLNNYVRSIFLNGYLQKSDSTTYYTKYRSDTSRTNIYNQILGKQSTLTFSTGLTNTSGTITNNLSVGVSGGQSVVGGTASGNNLTLSTTSNATKGKIILGTASAYDQANDRLGISTISPTVKLDVVGNTTTLNTAQFGTMGIQSFATNNAWFGDNVYYNGSGFIRRATGYTGAFYFQGNEGQFRWGSNAASGTTVTNGSSGAGVVSLKTNIDKTFAVGDMPTASSSYTGATFIVFGATGNAAINTTTDNGFKLDVNGTARANQFQLSALNTAPVSATATGTTGEIRIVNGFIYVCVATNTWQRATLSTW